MSSLNNQGFTTRQNFVRKCTIIVMVFAVISSCAILKLGFIQLVNARSTAQAAQAERVRVRPILARRGRIMDSNGAVLAQSVERFNIIGDPLNAQAFKPTPCTKQTANNCHMINGKPVDGTGAVAVARLLAPLLHMSSVEIGGKLAGAGRYVLLKRNVTPAVKREIEKLNLSGCIYAENSSERVYSSGPILGSLIGAVANADEVDRKDTKNRKGEVGVTGLEFTHDSTLNGVDGYQRYQGNNAGNEKIPGTVTEYQPAVNGSDIKLTIDSDVDWYVKKVLLDGKKQYHAAWGIAVVQDVCTGEIIALEDTDEIKAGTTEAKVNTSRAVNQTFEPGSIGKAFTMAGMLQTGAHKLTDQFAVPDNMTINGQRFRDAVNHGVERWTLAGILAESSNVGMVMAGAKYPLDKRYDYLAKFGLGQYSGLNLQGESRGLLPSAQSWDGRQKDTVLFGQGYAVNALQLTNAMATIANKGVKLRQSLVKSVVDANGHVTKPARPEATRVLDENVAAQMMNALENSGEHYHRFAGVDGYRVAAKSGTAEVAGEDGRLTSTISDWSGAIPADNPRFVITVVLRDPQGIYGGMTAGPLFKTISEFLMQKYDVPTSTPRTNPVAVNW